MRQRAGLRTGSLRVCLYVYLYICASVYLRVGRDVAFGYSERVERRMVK